MICRRRCFAFGLLGVAVATAWSAAASEDAFPFDREMMLDVAPTPGSKRIPIIEIDSNSALSIELWCTSAQGHASVGEDSITIVAVDIQAARCTPEGRSVDEGLLAALARVTNWRRDGDVIELVGATTLRFRLMTN